MSYILDALRKSDQQRRRGLVPSLPILPPTMPAGERSALLPFALLGVAALLMVGMAVAWLRPWSQPAAQIPPIALAPLAVPLRSGAAAGAPPTPVALVAASPAREAPTAIPAVAPPLRRPPAARADARVRAAAAPVVAANPAAPAESLAMAELPQSVRQQLPPLQVAVHAYSGTARDSLVSINGRMLREGDLLAPDLRLEQITPQGMTFSFRGYRFRRDAQ